MNVSPELPQGVGRVTEVARGTVHIHPAWSEEMPWLAQGITGRANDMSLFGSATVGAVIGRWNSLCDELGCATAVHAHQVHGAVVHSHDSLPPGLILAPDADGHATRQDQVMLAVSVADCVPVSIVAPRARVIGLLHAGWRGVAAGILEAGITLMVEHYGVRPPGLRVHFGPAICGECYEVGGEVTSGLGLGDDVTHADLRASLAHRAIAAGVSAEHVTVSSFCTRHGDSPFFSHRAGCPERQIAVLAVRER